MNKNVIDAKEVVALKTCLRLLDEITAEWNAVFDALERDRKRKETVVDFKPKKE